MLRWTLGLFFIVAALAGLVAAGVQRDWAMLALVFPFCLFAVLVWWFLIWRKPAGGSSLPSRSGEEP